MWFVPGSNHLPLRPYVQTGKGGALQCEATENEAVAVELTPGGCTFHDGRTRTLFPWKCNGRPPSSLYHQLPSEGHDCLRAGTRIRPPWEKGGSPVNLIDLRCKIANCALAASILITTPHQNTAPTRLPASFSSFASSVFSSLALQWATANRPLSRCCSLLAAWSSVAATPANDQWW